MNSVEAFFRGMDNMGKELRVFDWDKAAKIIKERNAQKAEAGLSGDLEWTGGTILEGGIPNKDSYTYLASTWATPVLIIDDEEIDCYKMQSETSGWDSDTKWPQSALDILTQ